MLIWWWLDRTLVNITNRQPSADIKWSLQVRTGATRPQTILKCRLPSSLDYRTHHGSQSEKKTTRVHWLDEDPNNAAAVVVTIPISDFCISTTSREGKKGDKWTFLNTQNLKRHVELSKLQFLWYKKNAGYIGLATCINEILAWLASCTIVHTVG
jgi:hypothetical protein